MAHWKIEIETSLTIFGWCSIKIYYLRWFEILSVLPTNSWAKTCYNITTSNSFSVPVHLYICYGDNNRCSFFFWQVGFHSCRTHFLHYLHVYCLHSTTSFVTVYTICIFMEEIRNAIFYNWVTEQMVEILKFMTVLFWGCHKRDKILKKCL